MVVTAVGLVRVLSCWAVSVVAVSVVAAGGAVGFGACGGPGVMGLVWAMVACMFMPGMVVRVGGPLCGGEAGGL